MKLFVSILFVAAFAAVTPGYAQMGNAPGGGGAPHSSTDDVVSSVSGIKRPTPKPSTDSTGAATATGPLEAAVYKDAKGKDAATTFGANDTVYLVAKNVSGKKGDKVGAIWYSGSGGKGKKLFGAEKPLPETGVYNPSYNLAPAKGGSPAGAYRVDLVMNSKVLKSVSFTVK